ncbi:hypothetical protein [Longispora sp. K20-0274]|uniref:hypothetical protein n=1 Tax=Longispora sp. K20-0274 TaxID=3088255 RepID=UPI003999C20B
MAYPMLTQPLRHPADPDPTASSKARAVLVLGVVALVTGSMVGGLVPAWVALILARQATAEIDAAGGFLTGRRSVRIGTALAWAGVALAATALVLAVVIGLLHLVPTGAGQDFDSHTS